MSQIIAEFWDNVASDWVDISARIPDFQPDVSVDILSAHIYEYGGQTFDVIPAAGESYNINDGHDFRLYEDFGGGVVKYYFTGLITNVITSLTGRISFEVKPELEKLKLSNGPFNVNEDTYRLLLEEVIPTGFTLIGADTAADNALDASSRFTAGLTYTAEQNYADLLHDVMLALNAGAAGSFGVNVINGQIIIYGDFPQVELKPVLPSTSKVTIDISTESYEEQLQLIKPFEVEDNLRADTGTFDDSSLGSFLMYRRKGTIKTTYNASLFDELLYDGTSYGIVISKRKNGLVYEYETMILSRAIA